MGPLGLPLSLFLKIVLEETRSFALESSHILLFPQRGLFEESVLESSYANLAGRL